MVKARKKKKPRKHKDKKSRKKPKKRKSKMALVEPHYQIAHIAINPALETLEISGGVRFTDDATGEELPNLGTSFHLSVTSSALGGEITAMKAIVLAAAQQHPDIDEVEYAESP